MADPDPVTLAVIVDLGPGAVEAFQRYERRVLPMLARHGGRLQRRLRTADGRTEVHVLSFGTRAGYAGFLADPRRAALRPLLAGADVAQRVLEVRDVGQNSS